MLSTTLTAQLQQNFAPIAQNLPRVAQAALDPAQFRNSARRDDGGGQQSDLGAQITAAVLAPLEQQRTLTQAALGAGDAAARAQLMNNPETLSEIIAQLRSSPGADPQALARATSAIDAVEQQAKEAARQIGPRVNDAVKRSYATSITRIYIYAFWLAIVALAAVTLWLPEIPLGKSNRAEAPPVIE